jgi:hypothetical protein
MREGPITRETNPLGNLGHASEHHDANSNYMDEHSSGMAGDVAERSLRYTKDQFEQVVEQTEEYVRENPVQAIAFAVIAGFILNRLPIGRILGGFVRLIMIAFKPAILAYGATKLYQAAQSDEE